MSDRANGHPPGSGQQPSSDPADMMRLLVMIIRMMCQTEGIDPKKTRIHIDHNDGQGHKTPMVNAPLEKILEAAETYF